MSACFAFNRGEAFLQLAHFLPFFWIWASLVLYLRQRPTFWAETGQWGMFLALSGLPISLFGIGEYLLKHLDGGVPDRLIALVDWFYLGDFGNPRISALFDYPNTLANYLVIVLGLTLGLLTLNRDSRLLQRSPRRLKLLLYVNVLLILACLYCSGSRNGYLVAAILLLVGLMGVQTSRWARSLGIAGLALIVATTLRFGIGGRTLSWSWLTEDPRVGVWKFALHLTQQRPLLGFGLGNYKLVYDGEIPGYPFIAHAHNLWLMLSSEAGLPVTILLTAVVGLICYRSMRVLQQLRDRPNERAILMAYTLAFWACILFSMLDVTLFEVRVNLLGWLSLAVLYGSTELSLMDAQSLNERLDEFDCP